MARDANQHAIVRFLRGEGVSVADLSGVGDGVPDLLVGHCGIDQLVEIKLPEGRFGGTARSNLNHRQVAWHRRWSGRDVVVVRTLDEAAAIVRQLEAESGLWRERGGDGNAR